MKKGMKIISIDDEPSVLKCLEQVLRSHGYELLVFSDAEEGLQALREHDDVGLALLDIRMPKKNGFEIYKELRTFKNIPVLFVTAYPASFTARSDDLVQIWKREFADGTTDIIYKPFDVSTLFEKVEALVGPMED